MHERFCRDRISGELTDPKILWSSEFPEWLQSLKRRKEHVRQYCRFLMMQCFGVFIGNPTYFKTTFGQLIHDQPISTSQIYHKDFSPLILFVFVKLYPVRIHPFRHQYPSCFSSAISSVSRLKHSEQLSYILPMNLCPQEKHFIFFLSDTTLLHGSPSPAWENQLQ
jgi:hypothetical protein